MFEIFVTGKERILLHLSKRYGTFFSFLKKKGCVEMAGFETM